MEVPTIWIPINQGEVTNADAGIIRLEQNNTTRIEQDGTVRVLNDMVITPKPATVWVENDGS